MPQGDSRPSKITFPEKGSAVGISSPAAAQSGEAARTATMANMHNIKLLLINMNYLFLKKLFFQFNVKIPDCSRLPYLYNPKPYI
jgi:hypothetical protein